MGWVYRLRAMRVRILICVVLWCLPGVGWACSCFAPGPVCSIELGKTVIFRGTVTELTLIPNIMLMKKADGTEVKVHGNGRYRVRFAVQETFSGAPVQEAVIYTNEQSSACGFPFQVGREYVVFTSAAEGELWASKCSRTALLEPGVENESVTWMRGVGMRPAGATLSGVVLLPWESAEKTVAAKVALDGPERRTAATDKDGRYTFTGLKAGDYSVSAVVPPGFLVDPARKVTLPDKGCAESGFRVAYDGQIAGRVVDADGRAVADLSLELQQMKGGRAEAVGRAKTDGSGSYEFTRVSPGGYFVAVRGAGWLTEEGASTVYYPHATEINVAQAVELGASAKRESVDFLLAKLRPTLAVRVRVLRQDGSAAAGLELFAFPNRSRPGEPTRTGVTDAGGWATLPLFPDKEYAVSVVVDSNHVGCGSAVIVTGAEEKPVPPITVTEACQR